MQSEEVEKLAETVFGDRTRASEWLRTPNKSLGGDAPLSRFRTDNGRREVAQVLNAIAYGGGA